MRISLLGVAFLAAAVSGCGSQDGANKAGNAAGNSSGPATVEAAGENGTDEDAAPASGNAADEMRAALVGRWGAQGSCGEQSMSFAADGSVTNSIGETPGSGEWQVVERDGDLILNVEINGETDPAYVTLEDGALRIRPLAGDAGAEGLLLYRCEE